MDDVALVETEDNNIDSPDIITSIDAGGEQCPICFNMTLFRNGRCEICQICGYSRCEI